MGDLGILAQVRLYPAIGVVPGSVRIVTDGASWLSQLIEGAKGDPEAARAEVASVPPSRSAPARPADSTVRIDRPRTHAMPHPLNLVDHGVYVSVTPPGGDP